MKEAEGKSIVSKLAEIASEIGAIKREGRNEHFGYDYFTEDQLTALLRPKLAQRNLAVTFSVTTVESREIKNLKGNTEQLFTITTEHKIHDGDSGEELVCASAGSGCDSADKGLYKAMTGAMKYFLSKLFFISDHSDPEADAEIDKAHHEKHRAGRKYEEETSKGRPASEADLDTLRTWLEKEGIDEEFVMELAKEGKLAKKEDSLDELKPGTLTRLLTLRERIKTRWQLKEKGVDSTRKMGAKKGKAHDPDWPDVEGRGKKKPARREAEDGDQTGYEPRVPIQDDLPPEDYLAQEGVTWEEVEIHFGTKKGTALGDMEPKDVLWWANNVKLKKFKGKFKDADFLLDAALCVAQQEIIGGDDY